MGKPLICLYYWNVNLSPRFWNHNSIACLPSEMLKSWQVHIFSTTSASIMKTKYIKSYFLFPLFFSFFSLTDSCCQWDLMFGFKLSKEITNKQSKAPWWIYSKAKDLASVIYGKDEVYNYPSKNPGPWCSPSGKFCPLLPLSWRQTLNLFSGHQSFWFTLFCLLSHLKIHLLWFGFFRISLCLSKNKQTVQYRNSIILNIFIKKNPSNSYAFRNCVNATQNRVWFLRVYFVHTKSSLTTTAGNTHKDAQCVVKFTDHHC